MREQDNLTITSEMRVCVHVYKEREGERRMETWSAGNLAIIGADCSISIQNVRQSLETLF